MEGRTHRICAERHASVRSERALSIILRTGRDTVAPGEITIRSHARAACRLVGRPAITVRSARQRETLQQRVMNTAAMFPSVPFTPNFLLQPGRTVTARFQCWNWCNPHTPPGTSPGSTSAQGPKPTGIAVTLRTGANPINATVPGGLGSLDPPICADPSAPASWITVSLWTTP